MNGTHRQVGTMITIVTHVKYLGLTTGGSGWNNDTDAGYIGSHRRGESPSRHGTIRGSPFQ